MKEECLWGRSPSRWTHSLQSKTASGADHWLPHMMWINHTRTRTRMRHKQTVRMVEACARVCVCACVRVMAGIVCEAQVRAHLLLWSNSFAPVIWPLINIFKKSMSLILLRRLHSGKLLPELIPSGEGRHKVSVWRNIPTTSHIICAIMPSNFLPGQVHLHAVASSCLVLMFVSLTTSNAQWLFTASHH